jgi:hypothetical protein
VAVAPDAPYLAGMITAKLALLASSLAADPACTPASPCTPLAESRASAAAALQQAGPGISFLLFAERNWFDMRTRFVGSTRQRQGVSPSWGLGGGVVLDLGRRMALRAAGSASRTTSRLQVQDALVDGEPFWITRGELGFEWRFRAGVPGYVLVAADAVNNPEGWAVTVGDTIRAAGYDAGVSPRLGVGAGLDVGDGPRQFRIEASYRLGRYDFPEAAEHNREPTRVTHDILLTAGVVLRVR